jgi:hypothetical protein
LKKTGKEKKGTEVLLANRRGTKEERKENPQRADEPEEKENIIQPPLP